MLEFRDRLGQPFSYSRDMPLHSYRKATAYAALPANNFYAWTSSTNAIDPRMNRYTPYDEPGRLTVWKLIQNFYSGLQHLTASSSKAGLLIPLIFILTGAGFIYLQVQPALYQQLKSFAGFYAQGNASIVADDYIAERLRYVSNPGSDYFEKISAEALRGGYQQDAQAMAYTGTMYLTIPSLGFNRLPITANVESTSESSYSEILNTSLAHFKGTSLPFSEMSGNTVIYGHSVGGSYVPHTDDPLSAFSFLSNLQIGDIIQLEMDGQTYTYRMSKSKIVTPEDFSIVHGTAGRETLTLLTCYPAGNSSQRYVAIATPVNN